MKLYFSHGLESGPNASKIQAMQQVAAEFPSVDTLALDYRETRDPMARQDQLRAQLYSDGVSGQETLLVGSSLGAWVSASVSESFPVRGCFLLAPAFGLPDYPESNPKVGAGRVQVIHGWQDDVVPVGPVISLCHQQNLPLALVQDGHRLSDSIPLMLSLFRHWLGACVDDR